MKLSDIELITYGLKKNFKTQNNNSIEKRKEQLTQLKNMLLENEKAIIEALKKDLGKSQYEGFTSEIGFTVGEIDYVLKQLGDWAKHQRVSTPLVAQPASSYRVPMPLGVVLIIGAWNYPIQLSLGPLIPAIAAGNAAIIKPSELAENCSSLLAELIPKYLDNDLYKVVEGGADETTLLLKQKFDHIFYTGGEVVGKIVMRAAAEHLTPVTLELGGKSPCIVDSNTSLKTAASRIVWGKWVNAGQTCVAPDYVVVERRFADKLISAISEKITDFYGSDIKSNPDYGRVINQRHVNRLANYLENQKVVLGGEYDVEDNYFSPTIVLDPDLSSSIMTEEIFGPILPICVVENINESIELINDRPHPLALYLYTKDKQFESDVVNTTLAGSMCINDGMMFMANHKLPFGGVGTSGMGGYHGKAGFDTFSHYKSVMKRGMWIDPDLRYPPYTDSKLNMMKRFL